MVQSDFNAQKLLTHWKTPFLINAAVLFYTRLFHLQTKALFIWSLSLALWKLSIYTKSKTLLLMCRHTLHQKCTGWRITWLWLKISLRLLVVPAESRKQGKNTLLTLTLLCWLEFLPQKPGHCSCSLFPSQFVSSSSDNFFIFCSNRWCLICLCLHNINLSKPWISSFLSTKPFQSLQHVSTPIISSYF